MFKQELESAQEMLYASDTWALLLIFQALDAAGKDGTVKHVMSGVNPQGCEVVSFKQPSAVELRHDFLWRCAKALPERGRIGVFNRSYSRGSPRRARAPRADRPAESPPGTELGAPLWRERYEDIYAFEHHLVRNGTRVVKFFLHVSQGEQTTTTPRLPGRPSQTVEVLIERHRRAGALRRLPASLRADPDRDVDPWAPWYVIPADHKPAMRALVGGIVVDVIDQLHLRRPTVDPEQAAALDQARQTLLSQQRHDDQHPRAGNSAQRR